MSNLKTKLGHIIPGLVAVSLPILTGITVDGGSVGLESNELSSIGDSLVSGGGSLINLFVQLLPYIIAVSIILILVAFIYKDISGKFSFLNKDVKSNYITQRDINRYNKISNNKRIYNEMYDYVSDPRGLGYMSGNKRKQSGYAEDYYTGMPKRYKHYFRKAFNDKYGYDFITYQKRYAAKLRKEYSK